VRARARFDEMRDDVRTLEVVRGYKVVASATPTGPGEIVLEADVEVGATSWLAARVSGTKVLPPGAPRSRDSLAHTGNVRVSVRTPREPAGARTASLADALGQRLDVLEGRVDEGGIDATGALPEAWTGVTPEVLSTGQANLLERIAAARAFYQRLADASAAR